jgi:hypothetical protein
MADDIAMITASLRELAESLDDTLTEQMMLLDEMDLMATAELKRLLDPDDGSTNAADADSDDRPEGA